MSGGGIGTIPHSGYEVRPELAAYDANTKFFESTSATLRKVKTASPGRVLKGQKENPTSVLSLAKRGTPSTPAGGTHGFHPKELVPLTITTPRHRKYNE